MPARFSAYPADSPALIRLLDDFTPYRIGRALDCELCLDHFSISRFHAELRGGDRGWTLRDIGSKNGLRVDGHLTQQTTMNKATWFAVGDVYCWLELLDSPAAAAFLAQNERRRSVSRSLSARLSSNMGIATLIPQTLDAVLELAGLERGFVLYANAGQPLRVCASRGVAVDEIADRNFSGSATAVERALAERQSVVCCDTHDSPWLGIRPSVRLGGIRALVCVPISAGSDTLGVVYADSRKPGPPITELDLELINNVASQAATALAARQLQGEVADFLDAAVDAGLHAPLWAELRDRKIG
jgi:GAF domain/FHA domain